MALIPGVCWSEKPMTVPVNRAVSPSQGPLLLADPEASTRENRAMSTKDSGYIKAHLLPWSDAKPSLMTSKTDEAATAIIGKKQPTSPATAAMSTIHETFDPPARWAPSALSPWPAGVGPL